MKTLSLLFVLAFFSCSKTVQHGITLNSEDVSAIIPNITRKTDILTLLGTPSFEWQQKWYYISTTKRYKAFFTPQIEKHTAIVISFNGETVQEKLEFSKKDINPTLVKIYNLQKEKPNLKEVFEN